MHTRTAVATLLVLGAAAMARAEDEPAPPPAARASASSPPQLALPRAHLLGDWLGARTFLETNGITPTLTFVTDALGNPSGGRQQGFTATNNLGVDVLFDLEKLFDLPGASFQAAFSERFGSSLTQEYIGNSFSVQQIFPGTYRLVTLAWRQFFFDDRLEFRLGRIAAGDDFLVSSYSCVFVQNGFCGNPVGIFFNAPGMTAYPAATWGGLVRVRPTARTYVMGGVYNGDPSIRDNSHHGTDFSLDGPVFAMGEAGYKVNGLAGDSGPIGSYKAGFWYDHSEYTDFRTASLRQRQQPRLLGLWETSAGPSRGNWGIYGQFDQVLIRFDATGTVRGIGVTGAVLASPDASVSTMPVFANAAVVVRGLFASRPTDLTAFGVVYGRFSGDLQDAQRRAQLPVQEHETALELTWRFRFLGDALFFQPDFQYVLRPGGTGQIADAFVAGLQAGVNF